MSVIHNDLLLATDEATGYNLTNSLRIRSSASAYMNRTLTTPTNNKIWTWSCWVKRGVISDGNYRAIIEAYTGSSSVYNSIAFNNDQLWLNQDNGSGGVMVVYANAVLRDASAWYHLIVSVDTTQATGSNRVKMYINGAQQTLTFSTTPTQNLDTWINSANTHKIASRWSAVNTTNGFDGYLAEWNFIDGQALTPSDFGETDSITGVWKPKRYTGTYGTNGFYLPFTDVATTSGSNAGLGKDFSGNGNYWTTNNISVTAGTTYDSMTDVPTLTDATTANYATLNPLSTTTGTYSNGNLQFVGPTGWKNALSTIQIPTTGKWYWESTIIGTVYTPRSSGTGNNATGILPATTFDSTTNPNTSTSGLFILDSGYIKNFSTAIADMGSAFVNGDVIGVAIDTTNNTYEFFKNNTSVGSGTINNTAGTPYVAVLASYYGTYSPFAINFGQRPFAYTPPSGYVALNTYNLPDSTIVAGNKNMDVQTWTGNTAQRNISTNCYSDFVWIKDRTAANNNVLFDSVRGSNKQLVSNSTAAELNPTLYGYVSQFNSTNFQLSATAGDYSNVNQASDNYVGWVWQAGQGTTSSNTDGSITSTVSVNASAGFSIVKFTCITGASVRTVGHGLGVAPSMYVLKCTTAGSDWDTYHVSLGATKSIQLNLTNAAGTTSAAWNNTAPTSTVFTIGSQFVPDTNSYVAYCWAEIAGFSKFGSYTGNGSTDGVFIYTGFRPKWIMFKRTDAAAGWLMLDSSRNTYNVMTGQLYANSSVEEQTGATADFLSNGFKIRETGGGTNASGSPYIYACFAENPLKHSLAR